MYVAKQKHPWYIETKNRKEKRVLKYGGRGYNDIKTNELKQNCYKGYGPIKDKQINERNDAGNRNFKH